MKTIAQTLKSTDTPLGWWGLWINDSLNGLDKLRITPKKRIEVYFEPSTYTVQVYHKVPFALNTATGKMMYVKQTNLVYRINQLIKAREENYDE